MITWHIHHSRTIVARFLEIYEHDPIGAWIYLRDILSKNSAKIGHMVMDKLSDYPEVGP